MKKALIFQILIAIALITPAFAHDVDHDQFERDHFDRVDTNRDGYISPAEHSTFWSQMFAKSDINSDGKISYDEFLAAKRAEHPVVHVHDDRLPAGDHLPNRTNANPSDRTVNKGAPDQPNSKYLSK